MEGASLVLVGAANAAGSWGSPGRRGPPRPCRLPKPLTSKTSYLGVTVSPSHRSLTVGETKAQSSDVPGKRQVVTKVPAGGLSSARSCSGGAPAATAPVSFDAPLASLGALREEQGARAPGRGAQLCLPQAQPWASGQPTEPSVSPGLAPWWIPTGFSVSIN